ncbi:MAG: hypothetical protein JNL70_21810 [Saprospiraceae bacterium]|nr:hypothetical protein [Saprospiraceae bacterium]
MKYLLYIILSFPLFCIAQNKGYVTIKDLSMLCEMDSTSFSNYVQTFGFKLGQNSRVNGCDFYGFYAKESEPTGVFNKVSLLRCSGLNMAMFMSTNRDYFVKLKKALLTDNFVFTGKTTGVNGSPQYTNYTKGSHRLRYYSKIELGIVSYIIQYWIDKSENHITPMDLN